MRGGSVCRARDINPGALIVGPTEGHSERKAQDTVLPWLHRLEAAG